MKTGDRIGLGWRPELAASILSHLDRIDVVEVILDDYLRAPARKLRSLRTLAAQVPVLHHGVGLGLASSHPVEDVRLEGLARVLDVLAPEAWSEHLAFVRAGGWEIGHLAAPPRTAATVDGALENLHRLGKAVGALPALENIASLVDPPGSGMSEPDWTRAILAGSDCPMLLDLHNLYANAVNFGFGPEAYLRAFPLDRVRQVHLSGGHWIPEPAEQASHPGARRLLDDHVHDVPDPVYGLLEILAAEAEAPLTVVIERDGQFPAFGALLEQVDRARTAVARGRARQGQSGGHLTGGRLERARV